ncbi:MAG: Lrp/AsnC ligand binding domain-containing protein [Acidobacteria bacterium]|nr:Lrp/AsnC ligand binding domain-containing protein [Acidobacteriota bacterium]
MQEKNSLIDNESSIPKNKEVSNESAYLLLKVNEAAGFFKIYQELFYMDNVVYCDATKGDYDIFLLVQAENKAKIHDIIETKVKKVNGVETVDLLEVTQPTPDDPGDNLLVSVRNRDFSGKVCSYVLLNVDVKKLPEISPVLKSHEDIIYSDNTAGKYNLVLFVAGNQFDDIDRFVNEKIIHLEGVIKVKEYPVINLFEM